MAYTLQDLAKKIDCPFQGNPDFIISHTSGFSQPNTGALLYLTSKHNFENVPTRSLVFEEIEKSLAQFNNQVALIVPPGTKSPQHNLIFNEDPLHAHVQATHLIHSRKKIDPTIHKTAIIGEGCTIGQGSFIGPYVIIGNQVKIGQGCEIGSGCAIMESSNLGDSCRFYPNVVVREGSIIGCRVTIHSNSVIGSDGHGYYQRQGKNLKLPQIGNVVIGDDVEIGSCTTIDRGRFEKTIIGHGSKLDNQIQIGHNVKLGPHALISGQSAIGGSTIIGHHLVMAGQSGIIDHMKVGNNVTAVARAAITSHASDGQTLAGLPSRPLADWRIIGACLSRLRDLFSRVRKLEQQIKDYETGPS